MSLDNYISEYVKGRSSHSIGSTATVTFTEDMKEYTEELGYIIGVILGDGSVMESDRSKYIALQAKDRDFVEQFGQVFCNWSGLQWDGLNSDNTQMSCSGPIECSGNAINQWRCQKGIKEIYGLLIKYQNGDFKVESLLDGSEEFKIGLLRGLYDSEGSILKSCGIVRFSTTDDKIKLLYMKLVEDLIGVYLDLDGSWINSNKSTKHKGEFSVTKKNKWGAMDISIPTSYTKQFYNIVYPTIERKRNVFENYINSDNKTIKSKLEKMDKDIDLRKHID